MTLLDKMAELEKEYSINTSADKVVTLLAYRWDALKQWAKEQDKPLVLYRCVFGNYFPQEVDDFTYATKEEAEDRCDELNVGTDTMWEVDSFIETVQDYRRHSEQISDEAHSPHDSKDSDEQDNQ